MALSPTLSSTNGDIVQHGLQHIIKHNASSPYPESYQGDGMRLHSNHGSSSPASADTSFGEYHGQESRYVYQPHLEQYKDPILRAQYDGYPPEYPDSVYQGYNTPGTSPPTPQMHTRSGYAFPRTHQTLKPMPERRSRHKEAPKLKRERKAKAKADKKVAKLEKPLSELTKDWTHVPVADINTYVNRSAEDRRKEVAEGKVPGKVKRPMNSFMLYRKAYQNRTKDWCLQNNHQVVSQVCGDSWPLEPDEVKEQFNEWARIERQNHQNAHPGYKFSPTKPGANKMVGKRGRNSEDPDTEESDLDDWEWHQGGNSSRRSKRHRSSPRQQEPIAYPTPRSVYHYSSRDVSQEPAYAGYSIPMSSAYQASNPGQTVPQQYGQINVQSGEYYQQTIQQHTSMPGVEDVVLRRVAAPGTGGHSFLGLPGGSQDYDVMSQYPSPYDTSSGSEYRIDPSLIGQEHSVYSGGDYRDPHLDGVYFGGHNGEQHWQPPYDLTDHPQCAVSPGQIEPIVDNGAPQDPPPHCLRGNTEGWHAESLDECGQFDKWMDE